jgi:hypothetical protein
MTWSTERWQESVRYAMDTGSIPVARRRRGWRMLATFVGLSAALVGFGTFGPSVSSRGATVVRAINHDDAPPSHAPDGPETSKRGWVDPESSAVPPTPERGAPKRRSATRPPSEPETAAERSEPQDPEASDNSPLAGVSESLRERVIPVLPHEDVQTTASRDLPKRARRLTLRQARLASDQSDAEPGQRRRMQPEQDISIAKRVAKREHAAEQERADERERAAERERVAGRAAAREGVPSQERERLAERSAARERVAGRERAGERTPAPSARPRLERREAYASTQATRPERVTAGARTRVSVCLYFVVCF